MYDFGYFNMERVYEAQRLALIDAVSNNDAQEFMLGICAIVEKLERLLKKSEGGGDEE